MNQSPAYFIPNQPIRDPLYNFRTHITRPNSNYDPFHDDARLCQIVLYRGCHAGEVISGASIDDFHGYFFFDYPSVTKKRMGDVVINAVLYNPRKLKGVTISNPQKAKMIYVFQDILDLQYGLEWQICSWVYKTHRPKSEEEMEGHLRNLVRFTMENIEEEYLAKRPDKKIDWQKVWTEQKLFSQDELLSNPKRAERPRLKSLL